MKLSRIELGVSSSCSVNVRLEFVHRFSSWKCVGDSAIILVGGIEIFLSLPVMNLVPPQLMSLLDKEPVSYTHLTLPTTPYV